MGWTVRIAALIGVVALASSGAAAATPAKGVAAGPPRISVRGSVTIPWHNCYPVTDFLDISETTRARYTDIGADVYKSGVDVPVGEDEICGYMGAGTYRLSIHTLWQKGTRVKTRIPVMGPNPGVYVDEYGEKMAKVHVYCETGKPPAGNKGYYYCYMMYPGLDMNLSASDPFEPHDLPAGSTWAWEEVVDTSYQVATYMTLTVPDGTPLPPHWGAWTRQALELVEEHMTGGTGFEEDEEQVGYTTKWVTKWGEERNYDTVRTITVKVR